MCGECILYIHILCIISYVVCCCVTSMLHVYILYAGYSSTVCVCVDVPTYLLPQCTHVLPLHVTSTVEFHACCPPLCSPVPTTSVCTSPTVTWYAHFCHVDRSSSCSLAPTSPQFLTSPQHTTACHHYASKHPVVLPAMAAQCSLVR